MEYVLIIFVYYSGLSTSNLAVTNVPVQSIEMCKKYKEEHPEEFDYE